VSHLRRSDLPAAAPLADAWQLDPRVVFLNHGSFGACPRAVLAAQAELRHQLEAEPVRFFAREFQNLLDDARQALADFVGADAELTAFVTNATTGVNTVLGSFPLQAGDELLTTDHEYNACRNALEAAAERAGASVVVARVPFPIESADQVSEAILGQTSSRTRLALIDHITSPTGLVLPIATLVDELEARGVSVIVDGAHAPGMVELDVTGLGASFYTGNCHKWLCAPKGAGFLCVHSNWRDRMRPLVISHGANAPLGGRSRFSLEFDWTGTHDPTPFLSVPAALREMASLVKGGWPEIRRRNRKLAIEGRRLLCEALAIEPPSPESMIGSMASMPMPDADPKRTRQAFDTLERELFESHRIDVPLFDWPKPPKRVLRISAQLYNTLEQYRYLAEALGSPG
jgi:isopenicillin-N epimerase